MFLSINSSTNLLASAPALIPAAAASPTKGIALANAPIEFETISINGFNVVKLVEPLPTLNAKLPNPLVMSFAIAPKLDTKSFCA